MTSLRVLISCGEASGELYASELLRELKRRNPEVEAFGLGGSRLEGRGASIVVPIEEVSVIGLVEVLHKLPAARRAMTRLVETARERRPDVAVLIDFSGFNLRLAQRLVPLGIPIVYYVSPQVWAWRRGRLRTIRETVREMLVLLPFEEDFYRDEGVPVRHVGHPLVDLVHPTVDRKTFFSEQGLDIARPLVSILPGSRKRELELHLPVLNETIERLHRDRPGLQFLVSRAANLEAANLDELQLRPGSVAILDGKPYDALAYSDAAIVASGTATLEAALCGTPMVVIYRVGRLSYLLGKPFVRVPYYAMVNLIAEERLVPECIQRDMTPENLVRETTRLLSDPEAAAEMKRGLERVKQRLGGGGASTRAAEAVERVARAASTPTDEIDRLSAAAGAGAGADAGADAGSSPTR